MVDCAIIGDTIAVNLHQELQHCYSRSLNDINSTNYALWYAQTISADRVLISIGRYDLVTSFTKTNLITIRKKIISRDVTWLVTAHNNEINKIVKDVAGQFGDQTIELKPYINSTNKDLSNLDTKGISAMWLKQ